MGGRRGSGSPHLVVDVIAETVQLVLDQANEL
jgi:hypothetical protein